MIEMCPYIFGLLTLFTHMNHQEAQYSKCLTFDCNTPVVFPIKVPEGMPNKVSCEYNGPETEDYSYITIEKTMNEDTTDCYILDFNQRNVRRYVNLTKGKYVETFFCLDSFYDASMGSMHSECKTPQKTQEKLLGIVKKFEDFQRQEEKKYFNTNLKNANGQSKKSIRKRLF